MIDTATAGGHHVLAHWACECGLVVMSRGNADLRRTWCQHVRDSGGSLLGDVGDPQNVFFARGHVLGAIHNPHPACPLCAHLKPRS